MVSNQGTRYGQACSKRLPKAARNGYRPFPVPISGPRTGPESADAAPRRARNTVSAYRIRIQTHYDFRPVHLKGQCRHCYANVTQAGSPGSTAVPAPWPAAAQPGRADQAIVRDISR